MMRLHPWFRIAPAVLLLPLFVTALRGADQDKWLEDRTLTVSPKPAGEPLLRYRLFPAWPDRKPGNAAPMYLRFAHERNDETKKLLYEKPHEWNELPLDKLPLKEAKELLGRFRYNLQQLDLGARRQTCEWNYALDTGDVFGTLLPDAQEMRMHMSLLVLKARVEIAEGDYAAATRTLETGFSFSQQVGEGPFLINGLVGVAGVSLLCNSLFEMVERPDAPNLYWPLTALPRPVVDIRRANEMEQRLIEMQFPQLTDLGRERAPEQWALDLKKLRQEARRLREMMPSEGKPAPKEEPIDEEKEPANARKYLTERAGMTEAAVKAMPKEQAILLATIGEYRAIRDDMFAGTYLPYPESRPVMERAEERLKKLPDTEAARLAKAFLPAVTRVQVALARTQRRLAALRLIEALRMHAAANGGKLPDKLGDVTVVPVPTDPATGKAFEYQRDGAMATITSRMVGESLEKGGLRLKVTLRK